MDGWVILHIMHVDHNYYLREAVHIPISDQYEFLLVL